MCSPSLSFHPLGKSESERLILSFLGKDVEFLNKEKKDPSLSRSPLLLPSSRLQPFSH